MDVVYPNELLEEILTGLSVIEGYAPSVKKIIFEELNRKIDEFIIEAKTCDSPLEFELFQYLKATVDGFNNSNKTHFWVHNQYPIVANGNRYRADFLICPAGSEGYTDRPNLVIECDGHDFHEKTKAQVQRDKKRDRDLQISGYRIMRFSGSEIFKNPGKCAREVKDFLQTLI